MSYSGFQIRHLAFHGPDREPAVVEFGRGLNVIYGASNTGKSFVVETIDFMLGGKGPLTDLVESNGYDKILLSVTFANGNKATIRRSIAGGPFELFEGLFSDFLPEGAGRVLGEIHSERDEENLSAFLLSQLGLSGRKIRKNAKNETQNLSFRNLARLAIVNEEEIIQKRSPLSDGNYTADTANSSVFKMLLTGLDDAGLVSQARKSPEEQKQDAQLELLDQLIKDAEKRINHVTGSREELSSQVNRLNLALETRSEQLAVTEDSYREQSRKRQTLLKRRETNRNRYTEVTTLLQRFRLLQIHYSSDTERLLGIKEAGDLISTLDSEKCPVCGASPEHHNAEATCHGNVELITEAANFEIQKIEAKEIELRTTIKLMDQEAKTLEANLPRLDTSIRELSQDMDSVIAPDLRKLRSSYKDLADKGASVREAIGLFDNLNDLAGRKSAIEKANDSTKQIQKPVSFELTNTVVAPFSQFVEDVLQSWEFPGAKRIHFDLQAKDLVIDGKPRTSYGKGLRAVTQAAFSIALLEYCHENDKSHPGFVVLDSPLLSYKEPESAEDDLRGTNLNSNFYSYLLNLDVKSQVIIIENTDPPSDIELGSRVEHFSGLLNEGRFGLFPVKPQQPSQ